MNSPQPAPKPRWNKRGGAGRGQGRKALPKGLAAVAAEAKDDDYVAKAIALWLSIMRDPEASAAARNTAAKYLVDTVRSGEGAEAAADTRECTDMDLARWILSVLEGAAAQADKDAAA